MGRSKSKAIVYLIISAVVIILIKLWLHYTSWLPIATIRAEEQARAVCKEYVLTCESVEINELIRGEPYAYLTVKVSDAEKLDKETLFECVRKLNHITCGKLHISAILESGYRKYRMDISYSESVLLRNNAWYYATDEAKQSYKEARNQERNERHRQARKCEVTNWKCRLKCLSPAKKYKLYKSSINKSIHFAQRSLSSSTRGQRVIAQLNLSRE